MRSTQPPPPPPLPDLWRRRDLARLNKSQLIDRIIELERNQADPAPLIHR